jgi:hypothetical protein
MAGTWLDPDRCSGCNFCGMDMDMDPYCVHPQVLKVHPWGVGLTTALNSFCRQGDKLTLWEKREPR